MPMAKGAVMRMQPRVQIRFLSFEIRCEAIVQGMEIKNPDIFEQLQRPWQEQ